MRQAERDKWMELLTTEREAHRKERQELLNRLAQPETRIVDGPKELREATHSKEPSELAYIGQEVPPGVSVGSLSGDS